MPSLFSGGKRVRQVAILFMLFAGFLVLLLAVIAILVAVVERVAAEAKCKWNEERGGELQRPLGE